MQVSATLSVDAKVTCGWIFSSGTETNWRALLETVGIVACDPANDQY